MEKNTRSLAFVLFCGLATAAQADYQAEVTVVLGGENTEIEYDAVYGDDEQEVKSRALEASIYFDVLTPGEGPLAEAAFLSKVSEVNIGIYRQKVTFKEDGFADEDYDIDANMFGGQFILPGKRIILRVAMGDVEEDSIDADLKVFGVGGYITDRSTLMIDYSTSEYDINASDDSIDIWTLSYKRLMDLGHSQNLAVETYLASWDYLGDDAAELGIDVTLYITPSLGVSVGVTGFAYESDYGDYSTGESRVGIDYFVNDQFHIGGMLRSISGETDSDFGIDSEDTGGGIEISAAVRF